MYYDRVNLIQLQNKAKLERNKALSNDVDGGFHLVLFIFAISLFLIHYSPLLQCDPV